MIDKFLSVLATVLTLTTVGPSLAADGTRLTGRVLDAAGNPAAGARVFVYDTREVRRPPDFLSATTGIDGAYQIELPAGAYWAVARHKKTEGYGPLMSGDKHSGEPVEVEIRPGGSVVLDFAIVDLQEAARLKKKSREGYFRIRGRLIDPTGAPVREAYVMASRERMFGGIPAFVSTGADEFGRFTLFLPAGKFHAGAARSFPPNDDPLKREIVVEADRDGLDFTVP